MLYWNKNVYSHSSCTYQIENKAEGCSILFTTSPASACPPSPTRPLRLSLSGFEWVFSARQQGLIRLSNVRCVRPPRWGLLPRLTGRSTDAKRENVDVKNIIQNIYMRTNGAFHLSRILEQGMVSHSSWQRSLLEVRKVRWRHLLLSFALLHHSHIWQHTALIVCVWKHKNIYW